MDGRASGILQRRIGSDPLKLGIIGCGWVTETRHLPALRRLEGVQVVAFSDVNTERLDKVANLFHIKDRYTDYRQLLRDRPIDAVAVCVPTQQHVEVALAALDAGKHVFIEKPLALRLDECDSLIERARVSSAKVMVGFNLRWHRLVRKAREMLDLGVLGKPESIRTVLNSHHENIPEWRKLRRSGGGVLFEQAVHHFDLWRFLLRSEVEEIFAVGRSGQWEDEAAAVTGSMKNGILVSALFSQRTASTNEIEIYGRNGVLRVSCYRFDGFEFVPNTTHDGDLKARLRRIAKRARDLPHLPSAWRQGGDFVASYNTEWRHFIDSIQHNVPLECTLEDGKRALQVVLAAVDSVSLGKPVKLPIKKTLRTSTMPRNGTNHGRS